MAWMNALEAAGRLPGILFRGETCYDFDGIPMPLTEMSWRKRTNLLKAGMDIVMSRDTMCALPPVIQIEPTNICNLHCPLCPTGSGSLPRKPGMMEYSMDSTQSHGFHSTGRMARRGVEPHAATNAGHEPDEASPGVLRMRRLPPCFR